MGGEFYLNRWRHWKWLEKHEHDLSKVSRKTKKAARDIYDLIGQPTKEDMYRWKFDALPNCIWCGGGGTYRDHPSDTGYGCPDCYGTGKTGWEFGAFGEKVIIK
jgi:hypothetical protein